MPEDCEKSTEYKNRESFSESFAEKNSSTEFLASFETDFSKNLVKVNPTIKSVLSYWL